MNGLKALRAQYRERWTKLMVAANTSDEVRKAACLKAADYYSNAADAVEVLIEQ